MHSIFFPLVYTSWAESDILYLYLECAGVSTKHSRKVYVANPSLQIYAWRVKNRILRFSFEICGKTIILELKIFFHINKQQNYKFVMCIQVCSNLGSWIGVGL